MDRARVEAVLSGKPAGGRKVAPTKSLILEDGEVNSCLAPLRALSSSHGRVSRPLELTSSQLPPIF